jgi:hypothetical protein
MCTELRGRCEVLHLIESFFGWIPGHYEIPGIDFVLLAESCDESIPRGLYFGCLVGLESRPVPLYLIHVKAVTDWNDDVDAAVAL